jgi:hypothetical protein
MGRDTRSSRDSEEDIDDDGEKLTSGKKGRCQVITFAGEGRKW